MVGRRGGSCDELRWIAGLEDPDNTGRLHLERLADLRGGYSRKRSYDRDQGLLGRERRVLGTVVNSTFHNPLDGIRGHSGRLVDGSPGCGVQTAQVGTQIPVLQLEVLEYTPQPHRVPDIIE